ncbi:hypothetical protein [Thermococcus henrietii]|uniref:hypothetical protein n=1 Tax=Thermococcus henrietii TaxID=2016361 RepID=UPI001CB77B48|nr:hypothetical protein [Thermococcus henrietii]
MSEASQALQKIARGTGIVFAGRRFDVFWSVTWKRLMSPHKRSSNLYVAFLKASFRERLQKRNI